MRHAGAITIAALGLVACAGANAAKSPAAERRTEDPVGTGSETQAGGDTGAVREFEIHDSDGAGAAHGATPSKIKPTQTEAALKFFVIDKDKGPIQGIVVSLTASDGKKYYTEETDSKGYAELLVPIGQSYELVYLSLGRRNVAARVTVSDEPRQNIRLTLRYKRIDPPPVEGAEGRFVLDGIYFDSGKATLRSESFPRLDTIVEFMTYKKSARIEIAGYTDNVGNPKSNRALSEKRAQACRDYLTSKGIDASRITAVGHGADHPIADNDTEEGRQKNRRIEAREL